MNALVGFPRHLSQHVGGFVIARGPLSQLVPIENAAMPERTVIQWDKDDLDALGLLKVDVLALGMLTAIRRALELVSGYRGAPLTLADIPPEDPQTYEMIQHADTVGVFQIESRAQMAMLPRLKPANFYDLVIEVAIVRPGPIQGGMVHPYLRRRQGLEPVTYPSDAVKQVLERTLGVPIFQEQVMQLAVVAAGFTPGEADQLRRSMAAWRRKGGLWKFEQPLIEGMRERGYPEEFARRIFEQIQGFGEYGFPESHSASFALLVYASAWLKRHEPAAFCAALLNSQPMGFYAPSQLVQDARRHGVEVRGVDVMWSDWDCTLEPGSRREEGREKGRRVRRVAPPAPSSGRGRAGVGASPSSSLLLLAFPRTCRAPRPAHGEGTLAGRAQQRIVAARRSGASRLPPFEWSAAPFEDRRSRPPRAARSARPRMSRCRRCACLARGPSPGSVLARHRYRAPATRARECTLRRSAGCARRAHRGRGSGGGLRDVEPDARPPSARAAAGAATAHAPHHRGGAEPPASRPHRTHRRHRHLPPASVPPRAASPSSPSRTRPVA